MNEDYKIDEYDGKETNSLLAISLPTRSVNWEYSLWRTRIIVVGKERRDAWQGVIPGMNRIYIIKHKIEKCTEACRQQINIHISRRRSSFFFLNYFYHSWKMILLFKDRFISGACSVSDFCLYSLSLRVCMCIWLFRRIEECSHFKQTTWQLPNRMNEWLTPFCLIGSFYSSARRVNVNSFNYQYN